MVGTDNPMNETINETHARSAGVSSTIRETDNKVYQYVMTITDDDDDGRVFREILSNSLPELLTKQHQLSLMFSV